MAKICKNCGEELEDNAVFCNNCKHNPDEKKKKSKKTLIIAALAVLVIGVTIIVICCFTGTKGLDFYRVGDINKITDEKTKDLIDSLSYLSECDDDEYICILTDKATDDVEVPSYYKGKSVSYVTAYPDEGKSIASLKVNCRYLERVCDFDSENDTLTSVTSEFEHGYITDCFNNCSALTKTDFSKVWKLNRSFCDCSKLEEIVDFDKEYFSQEDPYYMIESSYCNCDSLTAIEMDGFAGFSGNFDNCDSLKKVELEGESKAFESCFNDCSALETVTVKITTNAINDSFNRCSSLTSVSLSGSNIAQDSFNDNEKLDSLYTGLNRFKNSFNNCSAMKTIELSDEIESLTDSFQNCGVDIDSVKSSSELFEEQNENNKDQWEEIINRFGLAIKKLGDDGVIPQPIQNDGYSLKVGETRYDEDYLLKTGDDDHLAFLDKEAEAELTAAPDLSNEKIAIDYGDDLYHLSELEKQLKDPDITTDQADECRYYLCVRGYRGTVEEEFYNDGSDRIHTTTAVLIFDVKKGEIIHIHEVGVDIPGESTASTYTTGNVLYDEATEYILSLYQ